MDSGTAVIIGMATATVASAIVQGIFSSMGKQVESSYVDMVCKSCLAVTAITVFTKVIKAITMLG